jgi:predicted GNAT family N-acyltransferase
MAKPVFREVSYGSPLYEKVVALRDELLRKPLGMQFTPEQLAAEVDFFHFALVAEDEKPVACLMLVPREEGQIQVKQVAVSAAMQGSGLGAQLTAAAEAWAKGKGYAYIYCHARDPAIPFYERQGYVTDKEPFTEVGIPHRYMYKLL